MYTRATIRNYSVLPLPVSGTALGYESQNKIAARSFALRNGNRGSLDRSGPSAGAAPSACLQPYRHIFPKPYPRTAWDSVAPQALARSLPKLERARQFYESLPPASVMVVDHGRVVVQWGDPAQRIKISSMRKSLLSALYGIRAGAGELNMDSMLAQLGIDDDSFPHTC
jgi:hypothetical protein